MKRFSLTFALLLQLVFVFAQNQETDSLNALLKTEKTDHEKAEVLNSLSFAYQDSKPDSALLLAQKAWFLSKNSQYKKGESEALGLMATAYKNLGNFTKSLEFAIEKLKLDEADGSPAKLAATYLSIASLYDDSKDYDKGLLYAKRADSIIREDKFSTVKRPAAVTKLLQTYAPYSFLNTGDIFEKKNMLDSAIFYTQKSLDISISLGNTLLIGTALNNLGNIYSKLANYPVALEKYQSAVAYQMSSGNYSTYVETTLGLAKVFEQLQQPDSAFLYGKKSYAIASSNQFTVRALNASVFLSKLYKKNKNIDSAFAYQEIVAALKDSVESGEKIRELQNISSAEQLREAELEELRLEQIEDRRQKLQLLVIGIMIPIFFLMSILISRRKVHKRLIEFTGIVSVLLFFEYITLLLHPFIAEKSHHSPIIEIVVFVAIAAIITPAHHKIQHWLLGKLAAYNYLKHHKADVSPQKNITEESPEQPVTDSVI